MCRLYGFRANEPTKVECGLVLAQNALLTQSRTDLRGKSHADGWGIATYDDSTPMVEKHETAAFSSLHFSTAAERILAATVLAHVRRATVSGPALPNTHPFVCGPWAFAHNGTVRALDRVGPILEAEIQPALLELRKGSTDSELVFCWLLSRMANAGISIREPNPDVPRLVDVIRDAVRELATLTASADEDRPSELNWLLTDGHTMAAVRWHNSLHWIVRDGVHDCEVCGIPHIRHDDGVRYRAVVIASEPLTHEDWQEVPDGGIVVVRPDLSCELMAS